MNQTERYLSLNRPLRTNAPITPGDPTPGVMATCRHCGLDFTQTETSGSRLCDPCEEKRKTEIQMRIDYKTPYDRMQKPIAVAGTVLGIILVILVIVLPNITEFVRALP